MSSRKIQLLKGIYREVTPVTLFRMQSSKVVSLRVESVQRAAGQSSFDLALASPKTTTPANNTGADTPLLVAVPRDPEEKRFLGPNGMSMRPLGPVLAVLLFNFKGKCNIFEVPEGTIIPKGLVLLHEHSEHFALQPAEEMTLSDLNMKLTAFLNQPDVIMSDKTVFYNRHPEMTQEEVGFSENA
jgi:hypothetical protein